MATTQSSAEKRTDSTARVRPKYILLGIDKNGSHHLYHTSTETIHIVHDDGSRGRKVVPADSRPKEYIDALDELDAWSSIHYGPKAHDLPTGVNYV
jgi:hypothetical protein